MLSIQEFLKKINTGSAKISRWDWEWDSRYSILQGTGFWFPSFTTDPCCGRMTRLC